MITLTQPKVPEAEIRGSQKNWVLRGPRGSSRACEGVPWDPRDPLGYQPCRGPAGGGVDLCRRGRAREPFAVANDDLRAEPLVTIGLGRIVALHHRSSTPYQIR